MIFFEDVAAGDLWFGVIGGTEFRDVDAIFAAANFFLQHVDSHVAGLAQFGWRFVDEQFDKVSAGSVLADLVAQFVGEHIADESFVRVGSVEDPIGIGRQSEEGDFDVVVLLVEGPEGVGALGITE